MRHYTSLPPSPSNLTLSRGLADAIAQVHTYKETLTTSAHSLEIEYGIRNTQFPRLIIVAGRSSALDDRRRRILRQLNLSLRRVDIVPYDVLGRRAENLLTDIERHLQARSPETV